MLLQSLQYSLIIIAIYMCYQQDMILYYPRLVLEVLVDFTYNTPLYDYLRKPLYDCVVCMSSVYTILLWFVKDHQPLSMDLVWTIFMVAGLNTLAGPFIDGTLFNLLRSNDN